MRKRKKRRKRSSSHSQGSEDANTSCLVASMLDESPGKRLPNTAPTDRSTSKDAQFLRPGRLLNLAASPHAAAWTI
jgi:hypothetical protein